MSALADADRNRLTRFLGMLGSDFDGEVATAGRLADKLVRAAGLTWHDVLSPSLPPPDRDPGADPPRGDWRRTAAACRRYPHLINRWEADFLVGLPRFPRLSPKQRSTLHKIVVRLGACGCEL